MKRGGSRPGSGGRPGSGRYREGTKALRVPLSMLDEIVALIAQHPAIAGKERPNPRDPYARPLYGSIRKGCLPFTDDGPKQLINLNSYLLPSPTETFFIRVPDEALAGAGIHEGDILIVERSNKAEGGDIVVARVKEEIIVRRLLNAKGTLLLTPHHAKFPPIHLLDHTTLVGVVTAVVRKV